MTDIVTTRPLVRPRFLKWSILAFALLLPFVIHSVWDYIETRRLRAFVDGIVRKGEPVGPETRYPLTGGAADTARYYRAAAALASGFGMEMSVGAGPTQLGLRVGKAEREGVWPDDLVSDVRAMLVRYQDALVFGDRAAGLPFEGLMPGGLSDLQAYLAGELLNVQRLSQLRAALLALDGDGDRAVDSFYSATRLTRVLGDSFFSFSARRAAATLQLVLERTRPSPAALEHLSGALAELDHDDGSTRRLVTMRALVIQGASAVGVTPQLPDRPTHLEDVIARPWSAHILNRQLEVFSRLLAATRAPWPERIDRVVAVGEWPVQYPSALDRIRGGYSRTDQRAFLNSDMVRQAQELALVRSMRVVVAVERYRRAHGEQPPGRNVDLVPAYLPALPIDPFAGKPLLFASEARGYVVYSVGANRQDDGGRDVEGGFASVTASLRGSFSADTGIRMHDK